MATNSDHIEAAENVSDMAHDAYAASRRRRPNGQVGVFDDHSLCLVGGGIVVGFLLGYFVGAHRTELAGRWR